MPHEKLCFMKQVILNIPDNKYSFFIELIKNLKFVKVKEESAINEEALKSLEQGFKEIKLIQDGKLKSRPAKDFLNEL